ncbi:MAG: cysteine dioxygenase family protein [Azospirillaceae bacterium]
MTVELSELGRSRIVTVSGATTPADLQGAIAATSIDPDAALKCLPPAQTTPYTRVVLHQSESLEVLLMRWGSHRACAVHDHGEDTYGWVRVLSGRALHRVFRRKRRHDLPVCHLEERMTPGDMVFAPSGMIHQMENAEADPLITLHYYQPPMTGMRIYDLNCRKGCVVTDDSGAWWPADSSNIVREFALGTEGSPSGSMPRVMGNDQ